MLKLKPPPQGSQLVRPTYEGGGTCGLVKSTDLGTPTCPAQATSATYTTVSLARYQNWGQTCSVQSNADDADVLEPQQACVDVTLPSTRTYNYEIPLVALDALYSAGTPGGAPLPSAETRAGLRTDYLDAIDVFLIHNLRTRQFFCPSGIGIELAGVDPTIGTLQVKEFTTFSLEPRQ